MHRTEGPRVDATPEPMIRLDGVSKKYDDGTVAVHDLDLDVPEGETVVLVGPSGCGKSTTLKMVNRLIEPTSGRILLEGEDVTHVDPVKLRRRMGYVIQQTGLFPHQTIAANVATVPKLLGWDRKKVDARVHELLELVGLDPKTLRQALPAPALRRAAPAGRGGARARGGPAGAADGRAVRRGRPDRARAAAGRVHPAAARGAQDGAVRDPRPRRGGADGRPDRGVLRGRPPRAVRRADPAAGLPRHRVRRQLRRRRPRPQAALGDRHRAVRPRAPAGRAPRPTGWPTPRRRCVRRTRGGASCSTTRTACTAGSPPTRPATGPSPTGPDGWTPGCRSGPASRWRSPRCCSTTPAGWRCSTGTATSACSPRRPCTRRCAGRSSPTSPGVDPEAVEVETVATA